MISSILAGAALLAQSSLYSPYSHEECRSKLGAIEEAGIMKGMLDEVTPAGLRIVVDGDVWGQMAFGTKQNIAGCINLVFFQGRRGESIKMQFLDHRSHRVLGEFPPYQE